MKKLAFLLGMMVVTMGLFTTNVIADNNEAGEEVAFSVPEMRILDLEGTAPSLTFGIPTEGGTAIADATSNTSWINYTSVVASASTNKVTVVLDGAIPAGTTLKVVAAAHAGTGNGTYGTPTAAVTLSTEAQELITGIGSCYTGSGSTNGHQLTYTWSVDSDKYAQVVAANSSVTATYTIVASL